MGQQDATAASIAFGISDHLCQLCLAMAAVLLRVSDSRFNGRLIPSTPAQQHTRSYIARPLKGPGRFQLRQTHLYLYRGKVTAEGKFTGSRPNINLVSRTHAVVKRPQFAARKRAGLDKPLLQSPILWCIEQHGLGWVSISTRTSCFLVIRFQGTRYGVMHHQAHIRAVNSHTKSIGGNHNRLAAVEKCFLKTVTVVCIQPGMVVGCLQVDNVTEEIGDFFGIAPGPHVDNGCTIHPIGQQIA